MTDKETNEIKLIKVQTALALKNAQTEFWKVGVTIAVGAAVISGVLVQLINSLQ